MEGLKNSLRKEERERAPEPPPEGIVNNLGSRIDQAKNVKIEFPCGREPDFEGSESLGMRLLSDSLLGVFPGPPFLRPTFAKDDTITKINSKWHSKRCTWGVWILSYLSLCAPVGT